MKIFIKNLRNNKYLIKIGKSLWFHFRQDAAKSFDSVYAAQRFIVENAQLCRNCEIIGG